MIDWVEVGLGALWIAGLGVMLSALSRAHDVAYQEKQRLGQVLGQRGYRGVLYLGMTLFSAGMAGGAASLIEGGLWGMLAVYFGVQAAKCLDRITFGTRKPRKGREEQACEQTMRQPRARKEGEGGADEVACVNVLGVRIHTLAADELVEWIAQAVKDGRKACVAYANTYAINLARELPWFREWLNCADIVYCDGFGVKWGARLLGLEIAHRYTPPDWIGQLAGKCVREKMSLYVLGAAEGVAERAARALEKSYPGIRIAGTHHGFFDKKVESVENGEVLRAIQEAQPDILIVGFGMPLQERWLAENWTRLEAKVMLPVGALIDYVAGEVPRAPRWMTDHGLEWLGRLIVEPRRLWRRYLVGNPVFFWRVVRERLR